MKIINPTEFYKLLITEGESSLYSNNTYTDNNGYLQNYLDLKIFNKTGEWLDNQINEFNSNGDVDETTYGNFEYLGTVLDDTSYILPQYTELFKLEVLALEKDRDLVIELFDKYAAKLNNYESNIDDEDIYITLGEYSTPTYGDKQDIGGTERFLVSLTVLVRVSTGVITSKKITLRIKNKKNNEYEPVRYVSISLKRETDFTVDNKASYEKAYDTNKSDFTLVVGSLYLEDYFSQICMSYLLDETLLEEAFEIEYNDAALNISKVFKLYIAGINPVIQYGNPISFSVSFKKIN